MGKPRDFNRQQGDMIFFMLTCCVTLPRDCFACCCLSSVHNDDEDEPRLMSECGIDVLDASLKIAKKVSRDLNVRNHLSAIIYSILNEFKYTSEISRFDQLCTKKRELFDEHSIAFFVNALDKALTLPLTSKDVSTLTFESVKKIFDSAIDFKPAPIAQQMQEEPVPRLDWNPSLFSPKNGQTIELKTGDRDQPVVVRIHL